MRLALARALFARLVSRPSCYGVKPPCCPCCKVQGCCLGVLSTQALGVGGTGGTAALCVCDETLCTDPVLFLLLIPMSCFP